MSYALVVILDSIVVILYFILNPIAKRRRAREAEKQQSDSEAGIEGASTTPMPTAPTLVGHGLMVEKEVQDDGDRGRDIACVDSEKEQPRLDDKEEPKAAGGGIKSTQTYNVRA